MNPSEIPIHPVLSGKIALITGGAGGIGKVTASVFLRAGCRAVFLADILDESEGELVVAELLRSSQSSSSSFQGEIFYVKTDVTSSSSVSSCVSEILRRFPPLPSGGGGLDVAVNYAALTKPDSRPLVDLDEEYWDRTLGVNVTGTALCCKWEMRAMGGLSLMEKGEEEELGSRGGKTGEGERKGKGKGKGGAIVNVASINAFKPQPNVPAYTTSKHAVVGITRHAAMEGAGLGVRVNCVAPGPVKSEMMTQALKVIGTTEEEFASRMSYMARFADPHEVAQGVLFLCSPGASYITGTCLGIDGGASIK